jgi:hypothetical protein
MSRLFPFLGPLLATGIAAALPGLARGESDLAGSTWSVVVAEECQLGQIGKIHLQPGGIAQATALVETSEGGNSLGGDSQNTDLQGSWSYADNLLHLSFNDGSLTLDGPVKNGKFMAKADMKTDLGDPLEQDCLLKRN